MKKCQALGALFTLFCIACQPLEVHADKIVIFGASGNFGSHLVQEALQRGHEVVGVSRSPDQFEYTEANFIAVEGNPTVVDSVREIVPGADAVVVALGDRVAQSPEETAMNLTAVALTTVLADQGTDGPSVIILGGGNTSAEDEAGMQEILQSRAVDGEVNPRLRQIFESQWLTYQTYKASHINWTYVATPQNILGLRGGSPDRTGKYRASTDGTLDREPNTGLSRADIAVAMIDFAESGEYDQMRVVVAQEKPNQ